MPHAPQRTWTPRRRLIPALSSSAIAATAPDHSGYHRDVRAATVRQDWDLTNRQCAYVLASVLLAVAVIVYTIVEALP